MSGPDFDPDKYLAQKSQGGFDPDAYLAEKSPAAAQSPNPAKAQMDDIEKYLNFAKRAVVEPAAQMASPITKPLGVLSQKMDPYTGAPFRAGIGELQSGGSLGSAAGKAYDQATAGKVLPSTPSGEKITDKALESSGISPAFAKPTAAAVGPFVGGGLDATNLLTMVPGTGVLTGGLKMLPEAAEAVTGAARAGTEAAGLWGADKVLKAGEALTGGAIDYPKTMSAAKNLTGTQYLFPGNKYFGPLKGATNDLNAARGAAETSGEVVAGAGKELQPIKDILDGVQDKVLNTPGVSALRDKVAGMARARGKVSVSQLDNLVSDINDLLKSSPNERIIPDLEKSRQIAIDQMQKSPQGQQILDANTKVGDLNAVKGDSGVFKKGAALSTAKMTGGASMAILPETYHTVIGASKLPKQAAEAAISTLDAAYNSGSSQVIRAALNEFAEKYPKLSELMLRSAALAPGRVDQSKGQ